MEADEKICPRCAETSKAAARVCRHCGYNFETGEAPEAQIGTVPSEINKGGKVRDGCLIALVVLGVLIVIGALANPDESGADAGMVEFGTDMQIPDEVGKTGGPEATGLSNDPDPLATS